MLEIMLSQYCYQMQLTILPTILFILFCQFHIYDGMKKSDRIKGAIWTFLTSYAVMFTLQYALYCGLIYYLSDVLSSRIRLIMMYLIYACAGFSFAAFFSKVIRHRNRKVEDKKIRTLFGLFIYAQYMTMIYVALIFSGSPLSYNITVLILAEIWYLAFRKDFATMGKIYPRKLICESNICLFFEYTVVLIVWIMPAAMPDYMEIDKNAPFFRWLSALSILLYIFCVSSHKIIFNELYHRHMEYKNLSTDRLTSLRTRMSFINDGQVFLEESLEKGNQVAVVFINISRFKYYNQNYGNDIGDKLLCQIAESIKEVSAQNDISARLSDDHFAILTDKVSGLKNKLEKLVGAIENEENEFSLLAKIGVFVGSEVDTEIIELLDGAMVACNRVKLEDGERIKYYDDEILTLEKINLYVLQNVDRAVKNNNLKVYYQPIINVSDTSVNSAEALVRWEDEKYGFLTPDKFIPILEEQNQIYKIDCYVLEQICRDHVYLRTMGKPLYPIGFNISRKDFFSIDMVEFVEKTVQKYNISRDLIKIEITESALAGNDQYIAKQICRFADLGYKVWMDDFGSGYSSLNSLGDFQFDGIKLDLVFLRNMSEIKRELVKGIVQTAKNLGLDVLTEGVENEEQLEMLQEIGCDNAQGFMFSKPKPLSEFLKND